MLKETAWLNKSPGQCEQHLQLIVGITLSVLVLIFLLLVTIFLYIFRKEPVQKLQRARSRVYSKL